MPNGALIRRAPPDPNLIKKELDIFQKVIYNNLMKKNKKPLGKVNEARRKAESAALFESMLLSKHLVVTPKQYKGSRQANIRKAISESY